MSNLYDNNDRLRVNRNNLNLREVSKIPTEKNNCYLSWKDGSQYFGECSGKHMNGYGLYTFPDKSTYEGFWKSGLKHGYGTLKYKNGNTYKGDFINDFMTGEGVLTYNENDNNKKVYMGEFYNGFMHGYGKLYNYDVRDKSYTIEYMGYFKHNRFSGIGVCFHTNGNKFYEGHFVNGEPFGEGILYSMDGEKQEASYYISGEHQKDLTTTRYVKLQKKLENCIKFPMCHIHHNI